MSVASNDTIATMSDIDTGELDTILPPELVSAILADTIGKAIHGYIGNTTKLACVKTKMRDYRVFLDKCWNDNIAGLLAASKLFRCVTVEIIGGMVGLDCADDYLGVDVLENGKQTRPALSFQVYERIRPVVLSGVSVFLCSVQAPAQGSMPPLMEAYSYWLILRFAFGDVYHSKITAAVTRKTLRLKASMQPILAQIYDQFVRAMKECRNVPEETKQYLWDAVWGLKDEVVVSFAG
ncbi:hypothetical protein D9758_012314 [Tetrapyrgos nigripes]|uniref:Uncharacterized protein n=1 Tax=Tetrapyrgos nigripes TaxID=182062 RepID=A0A8H5CNQ8_9AGAR|nr:hypothetical protein D9758_012314 [Tetrapyrgos nigripes]